jgi:hypothetical protein
MEFTVYNFVHNQIEIKNAMRGNNLDSFGKFSRNHFFFYLINNQSGWNVSDLYRDSPANYIIIPVLVKKKTVKKNKSLIRVYVFSQENREVYLYLKIIC